jgi:Cdc6-like AAA superfamily ATPase
MYVISLYGSGNTGKTSTLRLVIDMLIKDGATITKSDPKQLDLSKLKKSVDVKCCLSNTAGKKICITTSGDDDFQQIANKDFVNICGDVDVWITASRNYGSSVDAIWNPSPFVVSEVFKVYKINCYHIFRELGIKQYDWNRIEDIQTVDGDHDYCNQYDAKRIIRFLKRLI